jgi:hypothetical protein
MVLMMGTLSLISYGGFTAEVMERERDVGEEESTTGLFSIVIEFVCLLTGLS